MEISSEALPGIDPYCFAGTKCSGSGLADIRSHPGIRGTSLSKGPVRTVAQDQASGGPLALLCPEATGGNPHTSHFSIHFHLHRIRELFFKSGKNTSWLPSSPALVGHWSGCLHAGCMWLWGAHLGRGRPDSTFILSKALYLRALFFWGYTLLPFPVMNFQDRN